MSAPPPTADSSSFINDAITGGAVITTGDLAATVFNWQAGSDPGMQAGDGTSPSGPTDFTSTIDWGDGSAPFVTQATWLQTLADQTVAPGKSVDVTASYTGLVGAGYGFIDWGDGKGPQPLGATGGGAVPTSGSISAHYMSVPDSGLAGTLYLYDMHGKMVSQTFRVFSGDVATLTLGVAENPTLFTPVFLNIPSSLGESGGSFTLTYSASNPNNDTVTGSGTDADPYDYTPAAGNFTLWTVDGSGDLNPADLNGNGSFINSGVSYPLSSLPDVLNVDGHTFAFYIQVVDGSIGAAAGAISVSVTNGGGDPVTATLTTPPPPQQLILPFLNPGASVSSDTSEDSTGTSRTSDASSGATSAEAIKNHAYGDAKLEVGGEYHMTTYAAAEYAYQNDKVFHEKVEDLVPGKIQYYTNEANAQAAAKPALYAAALAAAQDVAGLVGNAKTALGNVYHAISDLATMAKNGANEAQLAHQKDVIDQASDDYQTALRATYYVAATQAGSLSLYIAPGDWSKTFYSVLSLPSVAAGVGLTDAQAAALKSAYLSFNDATGVAAARASAVYLTAQVTKEICDDVAIVGGVTSLAELAAQKGVVYVCARVATVALENVAVGLANAYVIDPLCAQFGVDPAYLRAGLAVYQAYSLAKGLCFPTGTLVHTDQGPMAIESIVPGTMVWAYDIEAHAWRLAEVERRLDLYNVGLMATIHFGDEAVKATATHPFWVVSGENLEDRPAVEELTDEENAFTGAGRWVAARYLLPGDVLLARGGRSAAVTEVTTEKQSLAVHNLTIADLHAYAVGASGVLVHNVCATDIEVHHMLPREGSLKQKFLALGLNPEDYTIKLPAGRHRLKGYNGIHTGLRADSWNGQWKAFFEGNPDPSPADVLAQLKKMRRIFKI